MQLALDKGPHLLRLLQETEGPQAKFKSLRLVHVKRDFNAAADYISKRVIQDQSSLEVTDPGERKLLQGLNRTHEKLMKDPNPREQSLVEFTFLATARNISKHFPRGLEGDVFAVMRSKSKQVKATEELVLGTEADESGTNNPGAVDPRSNASGINESGTDGPGTDDPGTNESGTDGLEDEPTAAPRNSDCQDSEEDPEDFVRGETEQLSLRQTTHLAKIADRFVLDSQDALFYVSRNTPECPRDAADRLRMVVPRDLQEDILHHCHADFQGAHQGIILTYERLCKEFYWIGMFKDTERYVKECIDYVTAKGLPRKPGPSPDNLLATRPFQVVSMDFVLPLPRSARGNTALLLFQRAFSGFIRCKAMANTEAQDVSEAVFRSDWDELAEKLMWALNTSFDFTRLDTPFYLVHGWDVQGTVETLMGDVPRDVQLMDAQEWRTKVQRQMEYARAWARDLQEKAKKS
ncbi:reverse transcriptase [Phytophthora megakarya]|uniref:Reverse transcriptase n=1 Tax=Phytophthora megakarya TaxID=4795 RepID=A0A225VRU7_9STRA|nr:reverse transcriptase [Phytophthora megakarya]